MTAWGRKKGEEIGRQMMFRRNFEIDPLTFHGALVTPDAPRSNFLMLVGKG